MNTALWVGDRAFFEHDGVDRYPRPVLERILRVDDRAIASLDFALIVRGHLDLDLHGIHEREGDNGCSRIDHRSL